ncbi:TPA: DUF3363 domain-containing protein [Escherichia coli]|nr:DUF3363 domain-containing protein [Escherichia coli]HCN6576372.1 DUF3363 domain-containing protein [Escherichia coli]
MPRRVTLTDRQKDALLRLPTSQTDLLKHYTLSDEDLGHIRLRRRAHNRFGFALQLCVLRYPGRVLAPGELIPAEVIEFIGAQLGLGADDLVDYAAREETRHEHLAELRGLYGFRTFSGRGASELKEWLFREAEMAVSNEDIARRFVAECRRTRTVLPATSTIERLCAAALVDAERRIETRIASRLPMSIREQLLALLEETADDRVTRFVWLRQFEPGSNSSSANRLLDRLEYLQRIDLPEDLLAGVPAHRVTRLRRQGERYYADGMRDLPEDRRLAILAVCVSEWQAMLADAVVETHDRIVGRLYRASERICHAKVADEAGVVRDTLKSFAEIGGALVDAQDDGQPLGDVIASGSGWDGLKTLVAMATRLTATMADDPLNHVLDGYHRFRRYAPRMLRLLDLRAAPVALPLLEAVTALRTGLNDAAMTSFLRPSSKWHRHLRAQRAGDARLWEIAVLFHLRDAFRSGDVWLTRSRRYGDLKHALVPAQSIAEGGRLAVPLRPEEWLADRQARLDMRLRELGRAARAGTIPGGSIENGVLHIEKLEAAAHDAGRDSQASVRVLSPVDLNKQIGSDGATWLDRRLIHGETADLAPTGFGQQVREAMDQRREHHIEQGDATRSRDSRVFYRRNLLAILREREVAGVGSDMALSKGLPFRAATDGESVSGKFTGTVHLSSGKFAVVEKSHEFTLVPWRPIIDRQLGREVMGIVQGGSVSWQLGRQRGLER